MNRISEDEGAAFAMTSGKARPLSGSDDQEEMMVPSLMGM